MFENVLQMTYLGNTVLQYGSALIIFIVSVILIKILHSVVIARLKSWAEQTQTTLDDFVIRVGERTLIPLLYFGALYIGLRSLTLNPALTKAVSFSGALLLTVLGIRFLTQVIGSAILLYAEKRGDEGGLKQKFQSLLPVIRIAIWSVGVVFLLDNLGFKVSAVVAGLGIGGVAVALGAQAILGDLFSYFAILFDRPFVLGDFIIVGDKMGTIENIGIKTTRIRSLGGEQLIFSNTDLTNSRIRNYKRMQQRRIVFKLGTTYNTKTEQLKGIPEIIKKVINNVTNTRFDRAHFSSYGDFSLNIEVVYYVLTSDYNKYMDIQEQINIGIKEEFEKRKIEFAFPTQTLYLSKT